MSSASGMLSHWPVLKRAPQHSLTSQPALDTLKAAPASKAARLMPTLHQSPGKQGSSQQGSSQQGSSQQGSSQQGLSQQGLSWADLAASGDPWLLLLELFAAGLKAQQQQHKDEAAAAAATSPTDDDMTAAWRLSPTLLLRQLVRLVAPGAVAQAALWTVSQLQLLPDDLAAAVQVRQQAPGASAGTQQQQVQLVLDTLSATAAALIRLKPALQAPSASAGPCSTAAALEHGVVVKAEHEQLLLVESIHAQLLPYLHRAYLLLQLTHQHQHQQQQQQVTRMAASYCQVTPPRPGCSQAAGSTLPSHQVGLLLDELGLPGVGEMLQAATTSAVAADGGDLPPWLSGALLQFCSTKILAAAAAAAAKSVSTAAAPSMSLPVQQRHPPLLPGHAVQAVLPCRPCLMALPGQYQELYLQLSELPCGVCGQIPEQPALCLTLGR
jgi:hypothetical protein